MHVLTVLGIPIAAAERWERLSMFTAGFSAWIQADMTIRSMKREEMPLVEVLK